MKVNPKKWLPNAWDVLKELWKDSGGFWTWWLAGWIAFTIFIAPSVSPFMRGFWGMIALVGVVTNAAARYCCGEADILDELRTMGRRHRGGLDDIWNDN